MRIIVTAALTGLTVTSAAAGELSVSVEIPKLTVAEYHRPYVALWLENADGSKASTLDVWYDVKKRDNEGAKWLKDMRTWWRRAGRELAMPVDGISSPTRAPGVQEVSFDSTNAVMKSLAPGSYTLVVEAAREVGGRELLRVPFQWPPASNAEADARGEHELGALKIKLKP